MKRLLTGVAASVLVMGAMAPAAFAYSANYTDISGNFAQQDIVKLTEQGFIHGYSDGTFRPNSLVTRGQFLAYFLNVVQTATGVKPIAHAQYYRDIPPRNWDYNYVGAAQQAGWIVPYWIGVRVGGFFNENYQASWGDAASFFVAAMERSGLLKGTNNMPPLAYAKSIGLFNGIPSTQNQIYLNRASAAVVLENILNWISQQGAGQGQTGQQAPAGATVSLTGGTAMSPNTSEPLTVTMKDGQGNPYNYGSAAVTYNVNSPNAIVQNGQLVVLAPGTYQVTATVLGVTSAPLTVTVFGAASSVKLSAAQPQLVADGQMTDTITATVVDASGNTVSNFNGTMNFTDTNSQLVGPNGTLTNTLTAVPVQNGVATVTVKATGQPGVSDTVTGSNLVQTGSASPVGSSSPVQGTVTLQQVPQQATSLKVTTAASTVEDNVPTEAGFSVQVVDQAGYPMLSGTYSIGLSVSSSGRLDPNTPAQTVYVGNGSSTAAATGNVWSLQGVSGPITITATSPGLATGSATIQAVVVGSPANLHLAVDPTSSASFAAGSTGGLFDISTTDSNGNVVSDPNNPTYQATVWQGSTQVMTGVTATVSGNRVIVSGTKAGSYTLKVTSSDNLNPATINFTVTPGAASTAVVTQPAGTVDLPIAANGLTLQAQLEDAYGNPVSQSGVPVQFSVQTASGSDTATLNGSTSGTVTASTGANGQISLPFVGSHTPGDSWKVGVSSVNGQSVNFQPVTIEMVNMVPTQLTVGMVDTVTYSGNNAIYHGSTGYAQAGDTVTVTLKATDSYGNASTNGDVLQVTLPAGLANPQGLTPTATAGVYTASLSPANGTLSFTATAAQAGPATVSVKDLSVATANLTGQATLNVLPGAPAGAALFNTSGQEITSANPVAVTADQPVEVYLHPTDVEGNSVIESQSVTVNLGDSGAGGQFRLSPTGASVSSVQIPAGSSGIPVYYVNGNTGNVVLTATVQ